MLGYLLTVIFFLHLISKYLLSVHYARHYLGTGYTEVLLNKMFNRMLVGHAKQKINIEKRNLGIEDNLKINHPTWKTGVQVNIYIYIWMWGGAGKILGKYSLGSYIKLKSRHLSVPEISKERKVVSTIYGNRILHGAG